MIVTLLLVITKNFHQKITGDNFLSGPQKFHKDSVPRIGGVGIFLSLILTSVILQINLNNELSNLLISLCWCCSPGFIGGLMEDLTKNGDIKIRLLSTMITGLLSFYILDTLVVQVNLPGIDFLLTIGLFSVIFSVIAVAGLTNAYNFIDGFNGLASMVAIITLLAICCVAYRVGDSTISLASLICVGAIFGFFIWNYPRGLIFLGDCGAYLIGSLVGILSILLLARNKDISPWFCFLVNIYPVFETLFSIWRRAILRGRSAGSPDGIHFHSLIYRRVISKDSGAKKTHFLRNTNARTSHYLWILTLLAVIPAVIWYEKTWVLQVLSLLFCLTYSWIYHSIINFKTLKLIKKLG